MSNCIIVSLSLVFLNYKKYIYKIFPHTLLSHSDFEGNNTKVLSNNINTIY